MSFSLSIVSLAVPLAAAAFLLASSIMLAMSSDTKKNKYELRQSTERELNSHANPIRDQSYLSWRHLIGSVRRAGLSEELSSSCQRPSGASSGQWGLFQQL